MKMLGMTMEMLTVKVTMLRKTRGMLGMTVETLTRGPSPPPEPEATGSRTDSAHFNLILI